MHSTDQIFFLLIHVHSFPFKTTHFCSMSSPIFTFLKIYIECLKAWRSLRFQLTFGRRRSNNGGGLGLLRPAMVIHRNGTVLQRRCREKRREEKRVVVFWKEAQEPSFLFIATKLSNQRVWSVSMLKNLNLTKLVLFSLIKLLLLVSCKLQPIKITSTRDFIYSVVMPWNISWIHKLIPAVD